MITATTELEVIELIKKDREALIKYIERDMAYGVRDLFDDVPISLT